MTAATKPRLVEVDPTSARGMNAPASECTCDMAGHAKHVHKDDGWAALHDDLLEIEDASAFDALYLIGGVISGDLYEGFMGEDLERFVSQHRWRNQVQATWTFGHFTDIMDRRTP